MAFALSDYQMLDELGHGGFATVWRARQKSLGREVAIKCLAPHRSQSQSDILRFGREARAMAALNHDNIITVYDYAFQAGTYYIVMEYMAGLSFEDALQKGIPPEAGLLVIEKIASALQASHAAQVLHRDVKPANILLGRGARVKLADFGLAFDQRSDSRCTVEGTIAGTIAYLSPESLASPRDVDGRVDIFALGCILYRLLSGTHPFEGDTLGDISYKILNEQAAPFVPAPEYADAADLALRCLAKERDGRPSLDRILQILRGTLGDRLHTAAALLETFIETHGQSPVQTEAPPEPPEPPGTTAVPAPTRTAPQIPQPAAGPSPRRLRRVRRWSVIAAALAAATVVAVLVIRRRQSVSEPLPRLPTLHSDSWEQPARSLTPALPANGSDGPAPLPGTATSEPESRVCFAGVLAGDSVVIDGRAFTYMLQGDTALLWLPPGTHTVHLRRAGNLVRQVSFNVLPSQYLTLDLRPQRSRP